MRIEIKESAKNYFATYSKKLHYLPCIIHSTDLKSKKDNKVLGDILSSLLVLSSAQNKTFNTTGNNFANFFVSCSEIICSKINYEYFKGLSWISTDEIMVIAMIQFPKWIKQKTIDLNDLVIDSIKFSKLISEKSIVENEYIAKISNKIIKPIEKWFFALPKQEQLKIINNSSNFKVLSTNVSSNLQSWNLFFKYLLNFVFNNMEKYFLNLKNSKYNVYMRDYVIDSMNSTIGVRVLKKWPGTFIFSMGITWFQFFCKEQNIDKIVKCITKNQ